MVLNCGVGEDSWESLGLQRDPTSPSEKKSVLNIHWPPDKKNWHIWKDPDAGKDWRQEEKGATEDEMFGWHHWFNGHDFEQTLRGKGQGILACCSPWGRKESDMTEWLNWTELSSLTGCCCLVAKLLEFQLQHQSFQWIFRTDFL